MTELQTTTHRIPTPQGSLFAQVWTHDLAQGAPIVMLHDSLGCVALWRDFPEQLAQATGRMVIAYDRLGFGQSDAYAGLLPLSFVADEAHLGLASVLAYFDLQQFVLLGHSVGGGMAVCAAAAYAMQCQALITMAAQSFVEDLTITGIAQAKAQFAQPGAIDRLAKYHGTKAKWVLQAWTDSWLSEDFAHWRLDDYLMKVACPTLVIHGADDEYGSVLHPQCIAQGVQGPATLQIASDCGHMPHKEKTAQCLAWIAAHLAVQLGTSG